MTNLVAGRYGNRSVATPSREMCVSSVVTERVEGGLLMIG